jgi:hypothetical protein
LLAPARGPHAGRVTRRAIRRDGDPWVGSREAGRIRTPLVLKDRPWQSRQNPAAADQAFQDLCRCWGASRPQVPRDSLKPPMICSPVAHWQCHPPKNSVGRSVVAAFARQARKPGIVQRPGVRVRGCIFGALLFQVTTQKAVTEQAPSTKAILTSGGTCMRRAPPHAANQPCDRAILVLDVKEQSLIAAKSSLGGRRSAQRSHRRRAQHIGLHHRPYPIGWPKIQRISTQNRRPSAAPCFSVTYRPSRVHPVVAAFARTRTRYQATSAFWRTQLHLVNSSR